MKSWDLHVCDRASTITHVDRVKKSNPWYNKIWLCLNVIIWSSQICFSVIFIHFVMIQNIWEKNCTYSHFFQSTVTASAYFLVGSKSMLALLPFKVTITPKTLEWQVFSQGWWGLDLPILYLRITFPMYSWCATRNPVPDSIFQNQGTPFSSGLADATRRLVLPGVASACLALRCLARQDEPRPMLSAASDIWLLAQVL